MASIIHEFSSPLWVNTPLGPGRALLLIDYSADDEPVLFVLLNNTHLKCIRACECFGLENHTYGVHPAPVPPAQKSGVEAAWENDHGFVVAGEAPNLRFCRLVKRELVSDKEKSECLTFARKVLKEKNPDSARLRICIEELENRKMGA